MKKDENAFEDTANILEKINAYTITTIDEYADTFKDEDDIYSAMCTLYINLGASLFAKGVIIYEDILGEGDSGSPHEYLASCLKKFKEELNKKG